MTNRTAWRTSSYSGNNNDCVEVSLSPERAHIRDTKSRGTGTLSFDNEKFAAFLKKITS